MSYTRSRSAVVSKTISVSYPASENGGSKSISVNIPVDIYVHVDTNLYDANIDKCNNHINLLTGAVVATEAAEVRTKRNNAFKIGKTLISGFFGYVRSEISQQITELTTQVDSVILHLTQLRKGCLDKERQMSSDFSRITSRYSKIFQDLDAEIKNRITAIDMPAFDFVAQMKKVHSRGSENALLGAIAVSANESSYLHSILFASSVKSRAQSVIHGSNRFIIENYRQKRNFESVKFKDNLNATKYIPVMFTEYMGSDRNQKTDLYGVNNNINLSKAVIDNIGNRFIDNKLNWTEISNQNTAKLSVYFHNEMEAAFTNDSHSDRVKELVLSMWKTNKINVLSNN